MTTAYSQVAELLIDGRPYVIQSVRWEDVFAGAVPRHVLASALQQGLLRPLLADDEAVWDFILDRPQEALVLFDSIAGISAWPDEE